MPFIRSSVTVQPTKASTSSAPISAARDRSTVLRGIPASSIYIGLRRGPPSARPTLTASGRRSLFHLARELVVGRFAIGGVELDTEHVEVTRRPADPVLGCEPEGGILHRRLRAASLGTLQRLEAVVGGSDGAGRSVTVREADAGSLHPEPLIGQCCELPERSAYLTADYPLDRTGLLVRGRFVDDDPQLPIAGRQVRGEEIDQGEIDAREVDVVEVALGDVEDRDAAALAVVARRRAVDRTRTNQVAVARRQVG